MRAFQQTLTVLGSAALGACGAGLPFLFWATAQPHAPGLSGAAAGAFYLVVFSGISLLGALVGLIVATYRLRSRALKPWTPWVWGGIGLGLLFGVGLHVALRLNEEGPAAGQPEPWPVAFLRVVLDSLPVRGDFLDSLSWWPIAALLSGAFGTVGGIVAWLIGFPWRRAGKAEPLPEDL